MSKIILAPTALAQCYILINEVEHQLRLQLHEAQESYLVFLLVRFMTQADWHSTVLALDFFEAQQILGQRRTQKLQDLADKCLLFAGLFPEQAKRKRVESRYFVDMGQSAFSALAGDSPHFGLLAQGFEAMITVLQGTRASEHSTAEALSLQIVSAPGDFPVGVRH